MKKLITGFMGILLLLMAIGISTVKADTKEEVIVATDSATKPFTYKEGKKDTGYDIEVLKAVFKDSKKYKLSVQTVAFPSILTGIDAGRYQIAANDFAFSKEREAKYLFSSPISKSNFAIATKGKTDISHLKDLSGKKTQGISGANYMQIMEKWNKQNPDKKPIGLTYAGSSTPYTQRLQMLEDGQLDFLLYDAISLKTAIKDQGFDLKVTNLKGQVGDEKDGLEYFIFSQDDKGKELQIYVNKRLKKLKKSGQLKKLSLQFFEDDFVSSIK
ncbi:transporter substrate-binding domain-containing protein [Streptococcus parauberis]|uniref:ABC transporter, substrate-binding protein, family 3 n=3 Tax=Streptococcus parauberis TaxID=1348 RepID=F1Z2T8_9STRE|nr:transporter substrate-binding domain-containing protein [Streptococcus parauberis]AEF24725.1 extracellular solute-binding protein [Streptococcus parauberis KCTC 11537]AUT06689.1 L-cystine-binding protein TcyJ [Streptococcus parauberis]EGE53544.1 ABC transporter, substrate-binding protein, family 3 [Streptococcus parauberis NCFD 2020]EMF48336.1 Cysteine ABC transporter, substrate-binding protein [Streptococcus parauberis KRS-02109]EMG25397.1 Cysteine ABC transporter, substrate-binding protei